MHSTAQAARVHLVLPRRQFVVTFLRRVVRPLVLVLLLPIASSGTLPLWAQLVAPEVHVCHCHRDHSDCVCEKCNPELRRVVFSEENVKGRCGDDDLSFGGVNLPSLPPSPPASVLPPEHAALLVHGSYDRLASLERAPEKPPPRSAA